MQTLNAQDVVRVRTVLEKFGKLPVPVESIDNAADLYDSGLTSHASVNVMIALEDTFDAEFLDSMLKRSVFESVDSIAQALTEVGVEA